jgi:transcriptional regulator with XRE-family HTH domain
MDVKVQIGERIKELRDAKKLSQQDLANAADMERSFITHIEAGKRNISVDTLQKVLEALEISFKDFFDSKVFTA